MTYQRLVCTEEIFQQFNLPESLRDSVYRNLIGHMIISDLENKILFYLFPIHHGYYPDQEFLLVIQTYCFYGLDRPTGSDLPVREIVLNIPLDVKVDREKIKIIVGNIFDEFKINNLAEEPYLLKINAHT